MLYDLPSLLITLVLFATIILCYELGFRLGRFVQDRTDDEIKTLTGAIQASILGLLALLLGFTFNMAMQRYEQRSQAMIGEANAISTSQLRAQLLPGEQRTRAAELISEYVSLRVQISDIDLTRTESRHAVRQRISEVQDSLWSVAIEAYDEDPRAMTSGAFATALTVMFDMESRRNALLQLHIPAIVLLLLFSVFMTSGGILGYSSGLSGKRVVAPTVVVALLISLVVFIIIDLDRPKRGLIQVDRTSLLELQ